MTADQAAAMLQIPERGVELLRRYESEDKIAKAIQAIQSGFKPAEVCELYGLPYESNEEDGGDFDEVAPIQVYECNTPRCKQKGKVSTASGDTIPDCPSCHKSMNFLMSVFDPAEVSHMARTYVPTGGIKDPLYRTDRYREGSPYEDPE